MTERDTRPPLTGGCQCGAVRYVVTGAGSQTYTPNPPIRGGFASGAHGFMTVQLSAQMLDYALVDKNGTTLYAETITRA